jgi:hypothetical protein
VDRLCGLVVRVSCYRSRCPGFYSRRYQIFREVVGLELGPPSLVSTIEKLLGRNSSGSGLETREYGRGDPLRWTHDTLYPQKLALTSQSVARSVSFACGLRPRSLFDMEGNCHCISLHGLKTKQMETSVEILSLLSLQRQTWSLDVCMVQSCDFPQLFITSVFDLWSLHMRANSYVIFHTSTHQCARVRASARNYCNCCCIILCCNVTNEARIWNVIESSSYLGVEHHQERRLPKKSVSDFWIVSQLTTSF